MEKVKCYNDYLNSLDGKGDVYVFRGQAYSHYVLIPSGLREKNRPTSDQKMFRFLDEMKNLFSFDELTCIELAQHFQLPTRMLDFSYSYEVALFFSCYDKHEKHLDEDGKIFVFNKSKYERILKERNILSNQNTRNNKYLYDWLVKYLDKSDSNKNGGFDLPVFVDATRSFDRLYMQKGLFLLWGKDEIPFEDIMKNEGININDFIDTIIIDKDSKKGILEELRKKGICEDTLYMNVAKIKDLVSDIKYSDRGTDGKEKQS